MKNKVNDVRNHLVAMLEDLADPEKGEAAIERARASVQVVDAYVKCVKVELEGIKLYDDIGKTATVIDVATAPVGQVLSIEGRRHG